MLYKYSNRKILRIYSLKVFIINEKKVHIVINDKLVLNCRELYLFYKHVKKSFISIANNNW